MTEKFIASLGQLLKKGISLSDAIDWAIYCIPEKVREDVTTKLSSTGEGEEISRSFVNTFPLLESYSGLITQSLNMGELADTLVMISVRLKYEREVKAQMKSSLMYPLILCAIAGFAVVSMLVFIVPQVQKSLSNTKIEVGLMSQIVFGVSSLLVKRPYVCLLVIGAVVFTGMYFRNQIFGFVQRQFFSRSFLYRIMSDYEFSLFWSYISLAYISSRDLETAFVDGGRGIKNAVVRSYLEKVGQRVLGDLVQSIEDLYIQMNLKRYIHKDIVDYWRASIAIQLRSGSLDQVFSDLADFHRARNEQRIKIISKLSEPIAMIIIGGVIGLISVAMLSPFYEMTQGISTL